jgi:hypothetical protein
VVRRRVREHHEGERQPREHDAARPGELRAEVERDHHAGDDERPLQQQLADHAVADRHLHRRRQVRGKRRAPFEKVHRRTIAVQQRDRAPEEHEVAVGQLAIRARQQRNRGGHADDREERRLAGASGRRRCDHRPGLPGPKHGQPPGP